MYQMAVASRQGKKRGGGVKKTVWEWLKEDVIPGTRKEEIKDRVRKGSHNIGIIETEKGTCSSCLLPFLAPLGMQLSELIGFLNAVSFFTFFGDSISNFLQHITLFSSFSSFFVNNRFFFGYSKNSATHKKINK